MASFGETERARARLASERLPFVGGGARDLDLVLWDLAQVRHLDRSTELAELVAVRLGASIPMDQPPIGRDPLRVLESANMPAVLIELGYLTNSGQERQLSSAEFQIEVAQAIFDALVTFRDRLAASDAEP
jgi:N-acetylmuramoyl-L-alanine amidase